LGVLEASTMLPAPPRPEDCIWDMVEFALSLRGVLCGRVSGFGVVWWEGLVAEVVSCWLVLRWKQRRWDPGLIIWARGCAWGAGSGRCGPCLEWWGW
jgi:hypothetical protein